MLTKNETALPAVFYRVRLIYLIILNIISIFFYGHSKFRGAFFMVFKRIFVPEWFSKKSVAFVIAITAMFTALLVIANAFITIAASDFLQFSIVLAISFFAGIMLGAPLGLVAGFLGDLLGHFIAPKGAYNPIIGLSTALYCFIPGLIYGIIKATKGKPSTVGFIIFAACSFLISYALCTVALTSLGFWVYYNAYSVRNYGSFMGLVGFRALWQLPNTLANLALSLIVYFPLTKVKGLSIFF